MDKNYSTLYVDPGIFWPMLKVILRGIVLLENLLQLFITSA